MKVSRKQLEKAKTAVGGVYERYTGDDSVELYTMAVLNAIEAEVEEPPVIPGMTEGGWKPGVVTTGIFSGANNIKIAEVSNPADRKVMAGSKKVTETVVAYLEWVVEHCGAPYPSVTLALIDAIEAQGCNVDKFRG